MLFCLLFLLKTAYVSFTLDFDYSILPKARYKDFLARESLLWLSNLKIICSIVFIGSISFAHTLFPYACGILSSLGILTHGIFRIQQVSESRILSLALQLI